MEKRLLCIFCFIVFLFILACTSTSEKPECYNSESTSEGVIVHGFGSVGWIQNTNSFPVRIKEVWIFRGENTLWIKVFQPGEKLGQFISHQHGFYIYDLNGIEMGWIQPTKNGPK